MIRQVRSLVLGQRRDLHPQSSAGLRAEAGEGVPGSVKGVCTKGPEGRCPQFCLGRKRRRWSGHGYLIPAVLTSGPFVLVNSDQGQFLCTEILCEHSLPWLGLRGGVTVL